VRTRLAAALLAIAVVFPAILAAAQISTSQIDDVFASLKSRDSPGAAVLVVHNGKPVFRRGYGVTDLRTLHPIDAQTDFRLA
jgi:CubicO group peptidase (beta-lactamase class C family)